MTAHMRGASVGALAEARERIEAALPGGSGADAGTVGEELFAVVRLLDSSAALRRAVTDPNAQGDSKAGLVGRLLDGKVSAVTVEVVQGLSRSRWSAARDLTDAVEELGVQATLASADRDGALERVENELFRFGRAVDGDRELRAALTDRGAPTDSRTGLVERPARGQGAPGDGGAGPAGRRVPARPAPGAGAGGDR